MIPHNRPTLGPDEEAAALRVLRSGWLAEGKEVEALETEFAAYLGLPPAHAVALSSGTAALYLALHVLGAKGKRVAYPVYACTALPNAVSLAAGIPFGVDCEPGGCNADPELIRKSGADLAIMAHMYGIPSGLSALKGISVIEDCAQCLGARMGGQAVSLAGHIGVFSFYATKLMTSGGQGGMLVSKDKSLADAVRDYRRFDQRRDRKNRFNFQMTDLQAAIGRAQLARLPGFLRKRELLYGIYRAAGLDLIDKAPGTKECEPVRYRAILRTPEPERVISGLRAQGITAINPLEEWELLGPAPAHPNAAKLCSTTVSLPLYPTLAETDALRIAEAAVSL